MNLKKQQDNQGQKMRNTIWHRHRDIATYRLDR